MSASSTPSEVTEKPVPANHQLVREGKASILFSEANGVFYNKVQVFNRDLSILVIKMYIERLKSEHKELAAKKLAKQQEKAQRSGSASGTPAPESKGESAAAKPAEFEGVRILEALSATGLRSIRYFKEIPDIKSILVNDLDAKAVEAIKQNIMYNDVSIESLVPNQDDAAMCCYRNRSPDKQFDIVDLDPYGTAALFLDGAVQAVKNGGLLCVTCTDKAVMAGNHSEAGFAKYHSMSLHATYHEEQAVRILLQAIDTAAARYKRYIVPLVSFGIDFYVRVFVRVFESAAQVKRSAAKQALVHQCTGCESFHIQRLCKITEQGRSVKFTPGTAVVDQHCAECGFVFKLGGPVYADPLHDVSFAKECLAHVEANPTLFATEKRIRGMLSLAAEELPDPFYYDPSKLCRNVRANTVPRLVEFRSALINAGYKVSQTHGLATGVKTNAPNSVVFDILRGHYAAHPNKNPPGEATPAFKILQKTPTLVANFAVVSGSTGTSADVPLFPPNPEDNWGPKARARKRKPEGEPDAGSGPGSDSGSVEHKDDLAAGIDLGKELAERSRANQGKKGNKRQKTKADKPCTEWKGRGTCRNGDSCRYVHGERPTEPKTPVDDAKLPAATGPMDTSA